MTDNLSDTFQILRTMVEFAYEQGMHEIGYDPVKKVRDEIERVTTLNTAAPDLLEALKRMWLASTNFSCVPSDSDVQCAAKAIAKAEGRS